jgi:hypothetical protein
MPLLSPLPRFKTSPRRFALMAVLLAFWGAANAGNFGCVIAAEAELPDVEVSSQGIAIPAAPPEADGNDVALTVGFRQKPNRAGLAKEAFSDVHVLSVNLKSSGGVADLAFLKSLRITATSAEAMAAGRAPIEISRYARVAGQTVGPLLQMSTDPPADITELWKAKELIFSLEVAGQLPSVPWSADVALRVGATLSY